MFMVKKSINVLLYCGIVLFLFGGLVLLTDIWLLGFLFVFLGLIFFIKWSIFLRKGIRYFNQIPNYNKSKFVGKDYSKYVG